MALFNSNDALSKIQQTFSYQSCVVLLHFAFSPLSIVTAADWCINTLFLSTSTEMVNSINSAFQQ